MLRELKPVTLPALSQDKRQQFDIASRAGRDALAEQISDDIDLWCQLQYDDGPRTHLGASIVGHDCERYIWFAFRWMFREVVPGRIQRLFQRGHLEEYRVIEWLTGIGFTVTQVDIDGKQFRIAFAEGHGGGSSDGIAQIPSRYGVFNEPILIEIKTQKDKRWNMLIGQGMEKEKPQHFIQASIYGRRLGIRYCLYVAVNKENDELDIELIGLDWELADKETDKAERIISSPLPPVRISENPSFWKCKYCPANPICHLGAPIEKNCRSCRFSEPVEGKQWKCNMYQQIIPAEYIAKGCPQWQQLARV